VPDELAEMLEARLASAGSTTASTLGRGGNKRPAIAGAAELGVVSQADPSDYLTVTGASTANPDGERRATYRDARKSRAVAAAGVAESGSITSPLLDSGDGFTSGSGSLTPDPDDYLIPSESTHRNGERDDRVIWKAVKRAADRAGIDAHVHALRAAFAVYYLERNPGDLEALQPLMGHRSLATTQIYLRRLHKETAMERVRGLSWG
jgi:hypothetical protein